MASLLVAGVLLMSPASRPTPLPRLLLAAAAAALLTDPVRSGPFELPGIREEPGPFFLWDSQFTLRAAGGYKENVLLAATQPQDRALAIFGIEWFLLRPPIDANSFTLFFSADDRRYVNAADAGADQSSATKEQLFLTHLAYKRTLTDRLTAGLSFTHFYNEQVLDASEFGGEPGSIRVAGHGLIGTPSLRHTLPARFYAEVSLPVTRQLLREPISSYWEWGPKAVLGWDYRKSGNLEFAFSYLQRPFDTREQADPLGNSLPGTQLTTYDLRPELIWKQTWDAGRHVQTTAKAFLIQRTDNGEGFTDYDRIGASGTLKVEFPRWLVRGTVRWSTYDFPFQIVSVFDPVPRTREALEFEVRAEYRWTDRLRTYAEVFYEQQVSNVPADDFHGHVWQVGIERDF